MHIYIELYFNYYGNIKSELKKLPYILVQKVL